MKNTTKLFATAVAAVALFFATNVQAQSSADSKATRMGIGLSAGIPTTAGYSFAIGGDVRLQQDFTSNISGLLSVGYNSFSLKSPLTGSVDVIPVKVGAKFFVAESVYVSAELGAGFSTNKGGSTSFLYAPGVGYGWDNGLDIGLRYEGASYKGGGNLDQVALRLAYGFRL